ncbi:MAG: hypothetical protein ACRD1T_22745, partial [Acidimicrobiia bacterium]
MGETHFWDGPFIESSAGDQSWEYIVTVREPAKRLRIGIDHPQVGDIFRVTVSSPDGKTVDSFSPESGLYSSETLISDPDVGDWRVRVTAESVSESGFRMRARLEAHLPSLGTKSGPVLPNLQILPPHDASFLFPVTNGSGDGEPTGLDNGGLASCHPEEHAEDQAVRCLRFAFGVRNTGLGPMDLFTRGGTPLEQELIQRVYRANGTFFEREAGVARYHKTHAHFHHADAIGLQLFRVAKESSDGLEDVGPKRTKGFAHRNELLRDWNVFYPTLPMEGFGLRAGWSDIYEWDRPGNYIDFGTNEDGLYVLRMWADPVNGILESNEQDNAGYTFFEVNGAKIKLIESG